MYNSPVSVTSPTSKSIITVIHEGTLPMRLLIPTALIGLLITLTVGGCDRFSPESKKAKHLELGQTYFDMGRYSEALIEYKNVVQLDPKDAATHYRLALTHLKLGGTTNLQGAFAELSRTVELDKTNRDAQLKLGELYLLGKEPAKAREKADIVLVSAPQSAEGLILRGRSLIGEKRYQEGIVELKKAIDLDPKNMGTYIELARAQVFAKDTAAAEATLKQALTIDPRSTEILLALGDLRVETGKPDQAEIIYKQALDIAPEKEEIYLKLASFYERYGKWAEVEAALQKLAALKPQNEKPHILLGDFFAWLGQPDKALASYLRATELNASSTVARDKLIGQYIDSGKVEEAATRTKAILEKNDKDLSGRFFDARIRLVKGNADEAISLLQGVIKDEPQLAGAHHFLGVAFMRKGQTAQARGAFAEAVKLNPNLPEARTALAVVNLTEGSLDLAIEQAQAAIQLNPRNVQAAVVSGDAYLRKGDFAKSRQVFEAIAKALPNEALGPYRLGLVARAEKNDAKALTYFEDALSRKPTAFEPLAQIAMIKIAQGKSNEARERVTKQLEASPNNPLLYNLLGGLWMQVKNAGQAETAFKKALELDSSLLSAYMNLARLYLQAGKKDQAAKEYEAVLAKDPKAIQAHMLLGIIHESQKEYEKAQGHYQESLKINPRFAPAANNLAWILAEQGGNLDSALSYAQTAREQKPDDPHIADTLGWIYYKKNAYLLAVNLLKEAVEKLPDVPSFQYHYGMAQYKNGDAAGAKKALQASLKLNQNFPGSEEAQKTLAGL
jgi:tetratricopeptide (TPR) repeat protein